MITPTWWATLSPTPSTPELRILADAVSRAQVSKNDRNAVERIWLRIKQSLAQRSVHGELL